METPLSPLDRLQQSLEMLRACAEGEMDERLSVMTTQTIVCGAERAAEGFDGDPVRKTIPELRARAWERTMWHCFEQLQNRNGHPIGASLNDARFALERVRDEGSVSEETLHGLQQWIEEERRQFEELLDREGKSLAALWGKRIAVAHGPQTRITC